MHPRMNLVNLAPTPVALHLQWHSAVDVMMKAHLFRGVLPAIVLFVNFIIKIIVLALILVPIK